MDFELDFNEAPKYTPGRQHPPFLVTTSLKGDILYAYTIQKDMIDDTDQFTHIVILPSVDSLYMKGVSAIYTKTDDV